MLLGHNRGEGKALEHNREEKKHNLPVPNYGSVRTKGDCTVHVCGGSELLARDPLRGRACQTSCRSKINLSCP